MEKVVCAHCSSKKAKTFYKDITIWEYKGKFTIVTCSSCNLRFINPRPYKKDMHQFYPPESYWGESVLTSPSNKNLKKERRQNYGYLYDLIFSVKRTGSVLDIGAGTGMFLSEFKDKKWKTSGVEFSKDAVLFAQKTFGITLHAGDLLQVSLPDVQYDVITMNNSLEHVFDPHKTLKKIHKYLRDDGMLMITVPNIDSLGSKLFQRNWYALQVPRHLYHFSPETLIDLLFDSGFYVKSVHHGYKLHNYYTLFESFRLLLSPRFKKASSGGLAVPSASTTQQTSILKELGKKVGSVFATVTSELGTFLKRGEVITIYATKKS